MRPTDQTIKVRIVLITAFLALVGFFLEVGPVGGAFPLALIGFIVELPALGFLPYFALAASAAIGLHLLEEEPTPKEEKQEPSAIKPSAEGGAVGEYVRVRPELHQSRMFFTALGGYTLLKALSLIPMFERASRYSITQPELVKGLEFGFVYMALGWFILWQFLRWIAQRRRWVRLQNELIGGDVARMIAIVMLIKPLIFLFNVLTGTIAASGTRLTLAFLLHFAIVVAAAILWFARPLALRRTVIGLLATGGAIIALTILLVVVEKSVTGS